MNKSRRIILIAISTFLCILTLASCQNPVPSQETPTPTAADTDAAESAAERTLVYCTYTSLDSLYPYSASGSLGLSLFLEAIYDGPIDSSSYEYQPVILEKLPSLADGDAQLLPVDVISGDRVVNAIGEAIVLAAGARVRPSGCQADECVIEYDGASPLQMDQLVARFELLPGLTWSDGTPLTASDSVYSFILQGDPNTPVSKNVIERTASYEALDELATEWRGLPGFRDSTYSIKFFTPAPEHAWGQYTAAELLTAEVSTRRPLGWGPYVVEDFNPEESITLRRNENYFRSNEGLPHFDRLVMRTVTDDVNANLAMLLSGECDVLNRVALGAINKEEVALLNDLDARGEISASFVAGTAFEHLDFGIQPASYDDGWQPGDRPDYFSDVRVRRAFALCMDRQKMLEEATLSQPLVPDAYVPPQHPLYNPDVTQYEFDPAAGSALLEEAGWVLGQDGVRVYQGDSQRIPADTRLSVANYARDNTSQASVNVMVASLAQCGIEMLPSYWNGIELFDDGPDGPVWGRKFDMAQFRWFTGVNPPCGTWLSENIPGADPAIFPSGWAGSNNPGFSSPEYDQACRSALQTLPGQPGYVENHLRAQEIFSEQLPVIMLYYNTYSGATRPDFCNYRLDPTTNQDNWNIEEFDYGPDC